MTQIPLRIAAANRGKKLPILLQMKKAEDQGKKKPIKFIQQFQDRLNIHLEL